MTTRNAPFVRQMSELKRKESVITINRRNSQVKRTRTHSELSLPAKQIQSLSREVGHSFTELETSLLSALQSWLSICVEPIAQNRTAISLKTLSEQLQAFVGLSLSVSEEFATHVFKDLGKKETSEIAQEILTVPRKTSDASFYNSISKWKLLSELKYCWLYHEDSFAWAIVNDESTVGKLLHYFMANYGKRYEFRNWSDESSEISVVWRPIPCFTTIYGQEPVVSAISVKPKSPMLHLRSVSLLFDRLCSLKQPSLVLLADSIARHNIVAFDHKSPTAAVRLAKKRAQPIYENIMRVFNSLSSEERGLIKVWPWDVMVENSPSFTAMLEICKDHLKTDQYLGKRISDVAKRYLVGRSRHSQGSMAKQLPHVVAYILEELPVLIAGVSVKNGLHYSQILYPVSRGEADRISELYKREDSLERLVHDLQTDARFEKLRGDVLACGEIRQAGNGWVNLPV